MASSKFKPATVARVSTSMGPFYEIWTTTPLAQKKHIVNQILAEEKSSNELQF
jgi:hypothetical protein